MKKGTMAYEIGKKCKGLLDSGQYLCTILSQKQGYLQWLEPTVSCSSQRQLNLPMYND